jgi:transcriptional regulator with XRE-family HTH domain
MKGATLKRIRKGREWTQVQLAEAAGLHPNTVARMERDEMAITPAMERLFRLLASQKKG